MAGRNFAAQNYRPHPQGGSEPKSGKGERSKSESELAFDRRGEWRVGPAEWRSDPSLQLETVEFWDVIAGCLSELPPSLADAFTLRELDGLEANEVQSILDISPANFWKHPPRQFCLAGICLIPVVRRTDEEVNLIMTSKVFPSMTFFQTAFALLNMPCEGMTRVASESLDRDLSLLEAVVFEIAFDLLLGMPPLSPTTQVHAKRISTAGTAGRSRGVLPRAGTARRGPRANQTRTQKTLTASED